MRRLSRTWCSLRSSRKAVGRAYAKRASLYERSNKTIRLEREQDSQLEPEHELELEHELGQEMEQEL